MRVKLFLLSHCCFIHCIHVHVHVHRTCTCNICSRTIKLSTVTAGFGYKDTTNLLILVIVMTFLLN